MKKIVLYIILLMGLTLAFTVAYVSIKGLMMVFSGVGLLGLIFFTSIELSKIVATTTLHTYGDKLGFWYKSILTLFIFIAMLITSIGVYGFLTHNYQKTTNKLLISKSEIGLIETKKDFLNRRVESIEEQIRNGNNQINELVNLRNRQEVRLDSLYNRNQITNARRVQSTVNDINNELTNKQEGLNILYSELSRINDSIIGLDIDILDKNSKNEVSSELGPLIYLAEITNSNMDSVIKWFVLLLILIGDPMAVLMVILFTKVTISSETNGTKIKDLRFVTYKDTPPPPNHEEPNSREMVNKSTKVEGEPKTNKDTITPPPIKENGNEKPREKITIDDIAERKNRGFSVEIPNPEKKNKHSISRIGTNKETRGDDKHIYYNKK